MQCLNAAVSERHKKGAGTHKFFSVYLDDFSEFIPKTFTSLLNKARSANVGVTFAHQALGDLKALGEDIENTILVNSNLKVFMRTNEPNSAEYFSKFVGTTLSQKVTERQTKNLMGPQKTGEASVREVEQFVYHPNMFKSQLGVGEGIMIIPHDKGAQAVKLKFSMLPDLPSSTIPEFDKSEPVGFKIDCDSKQEDNAVNEKLRDDVPVQSSPALVGPANSSSDDGADSSKAVSLVLTVLSTLAIVCLSSCASKPKKTICDYESGHPNTRFLLVGSCVKTSRMITGFEWIETTVADGKITQGHLVLQTSAEQKAGNK